MTQTADEVAARLKDAGLDTYEKSWILGYLVNADPDLVAKAIDAFQRWNRG